jgi:peptidoglycan glycosyltransferase
LRYFHKNTDPQYAQCLSSVPKEDYNKTIQHKDNEMPHMSPIHRQAARVLTLAAFTIVSNTIGLSSTSDAPQLKKTALPLSIDIVWQDDRPFIADAEGVLHRSTIDPELQLKLQAFIAERGLPISAVVVSDINSGKILAIAQGRAPQAWQASTHTALHNRFPAASLFKTVVTAAAMEMTSTTSDQNFGLPGGCGGQDILPKGDWINDGHGQRMNLRRAYGHSCNSFFAKLAINQLGLGTIMRYAHLFGWDQELPTDFSVESSRMLPPGVANSGTHTVGRFAAGFGHVGISPIHANWIVTMLANKGVSKPLFIFSDTNLDALTASVPAEPIMSADTASRLIDVMKETVEDGTASTTFGRGRYRSIARETGGKTGTLRGRTPEGLTTLFFGVYPLSKPQIAVSSVVVLEDHYHFKASQLAAEAILQWRDLSDAKQGIIRSASASERKVYSRSRKKPRQARR